VAFHEIRRYAHRTSSVSLTEPGRCRRRGDRASRRRRSSRCSQVQRRGRELRPRQPAGRGGNPLRQLDRAPWSGRAGSPDMQPRSAAGPSEPSAPRPCQTGGVSWVPAMIHHRPGVLGAIDVRGVANARLFVTRSAQPWRSRTRAPDRAAWLRTSAMKLLGRAHRALPRIHQGRSTVSHTGRPAPAPGRARGRRRAGLRQVELFRTAMAHRDSFGSFGGEETTARRIERAQRSGSREE